MKFRVLLLLVPTIVLVLYLAADRNPNNSVDLRPVVARSNGPESSGGASQTRGSDNSSRALAVAARSSNGASATLGPLPKSLRGTDVDGGLSLDDDGLFFADTDALALFDYFLTALGEESYEDVVARITAEIHSRLLEPAASGAVAFLTQYLEYRTRAAEFETPGSLSAGLDRLSALRREMFGTDVAARLFGDEELRARVTIAQRDIAADPELSESEKTRLLEEEFAKLPAALLESQQRATAHLDLARTESSMREDGASGEDIAAMREQRFGREAAERLRRLDVRRAEWDGRVDEYRLLRESIQNDANLTQQERKSLVEELLHERFTDPERIRVAALDRIEASDNDR
jgi:lipase chaperone LimK